MNRREASSTRDRFLKTALAFVCLGLANVMASTQEPSPPIAQPRIWEPYKRAWDATKDRIDLAEMGFWLSDLASQYPEVRSGALKHFQEETGITDYVTEPPKEGTQEQKQLKVWGQYVSVIRVTVEKGIPRLLQGPTGELNAEGRRRDTVRDMGTECPHPAFVPLLREIALNEEENESIRYWAVSSLSYIPHDGMVESLIECLDVQSRHVRRRTLRQLEKITAVKGGPPQLLDADLKDLKRRWQAWWAENKHTFKYNRLAAMWEH